MPARLSGVCAALAAGFCASVERVSITIMYSGSLASFSASKASTMPRSFAVSSSAGASIIAVSASMRPGRAARSAANAGSSKLL